MRVVLVVLLGWTPLRASLAQLGVLVAHLDQSRVLRARSYERRTLGVVVKMKSTGSTGNETIQVACCSDIITASNKEPVHGGRELGHAA